MNTEPFDGDDAVDGDQTLLQELVWSVGLIGGVIAFLLLVVHFAAQDLRFSGAPFNARDVRSRRC